MQMLQDTLGTWPCQGQEEYDASLHSALAAHNRGSTLVRSQSNMHVYLTGYSILPNLTEEGNQWYSIVALLGYSPADKHTLESDTKDLFHYCFIESAVTG